MTLAINPMVNWAAHFSGHFNTKTNPPIDTSTIANTTDRFHFSGVAKPPLQRVKLSIHEFETQVNNLLKEVTPETKTPILYQLNEALDTLLQQKNINGLSAKKTILCNALHQLLGNQGQGNTAIAQINFTVGDLLGNARKIMTYMDVAEKIGVDTVIFPEQPLTGWPLGDLPSFYPQLIQDQLKLLNAIVQRSGKTRAMVGFIEPRYTQFSEAGEGRKFYNSVAIIGEGKIEGVIRKSLIPTYNEFFEGRQLEASPSSGNINSRNGLNTIHGLTYATTICEDIWATPDKTSRTLYARNPIHELSKSEPNILVNISASPTRSGKEASKNAMLSHIAKQENTPLVYVNAIGGNDDLVYEGASRMYNNAGQLIARAKSFEEQFLIVNPKTSLGKIYPLAEQEPTVAAITHQNMFDAASTHDLERTYKATTLAIKDYFNKNGYSKAVLGISGGIDSAVAATLATDALGKKNVLGVFMPSNGITQDESRQDAQTLAKNLGIPLVTMPIGNVLNSVWQVLDPAFKEISNIWGEPACDPKTNQNNQARIRSLFLRAITNQYGKVLNIGTSDKSEAIIGNGTVAGDMSSDYAVLKDITKLKLNALSVWINQNTGPKNRIPRNIITKPPTAELDKKTDSDEILSDDERYGSTFLLRDEAMHQLLRGEDFTAMLKSQFEADLKEGLTPEEKKLALERFFYHLAKNGIFKWGHLAKGPIIDNKGFTPGELQIPITAGYNIPWDGVSDAEIDTALNIKKPYQQAKFTERVTKHLQDLGIIASE